MVHGNVETIDLADLGQFIANLANSGMPLFPDADLEVALLEAAKLPTSGVIDPLTELYGHDTVAGEDGDLVPAPTQIVEPPSQLPGKPPAGTLPSRPTGPASPVPGQSATQGTQKILEMARRELAKAKPRGRSMTGYNKRYVVRRDKAGRISEILEAA